MYPQPIPVQYPPLLGFLGPAGALACATAAHAGVAATLGLACRPRRRLAHGRVGAGIGCDSSPGLSLLSSIPELIERRPSRLRVGERFQSRLEPGLFRCGEFRTATRFNPRLDR